jgi:aminoglycoside phosphotransferase (APT) family kinase protein
LVSYPGLTAQQQKALPTLLAPARPFETKFEDSTHQLWQCDTVDGSMVLKLCNRKSIHDSTFWQATNCLFKLNFPDSLAQIDKIHQLISELSPVAIPDFVAAQASSFVLVRWLEGDDVAVDIVSDGMVVQLADHMAQLHQHKRSQWGSVEQPLFLAKEWSERLANTLSLLADRQSIPSDIADQAIAQALSLEIDTFCPIMLDLRWDQMLHRQGDLCAIVDMDAFVIGPKELELVLLEYQLTAKQAVLFKHRYEQLIKTNFPDLSACRDCYRLLLFVMNSLDETDVEKWMAAERLFDNG